MSDVLELRIVCRQLRAKKKKITVVTCKSLPKSVVVKKKKYTEFCRILFFLGKSSILIRKKKKLWRLLFFLSKLSFFFPFLYCWIKQQYFGVFFFCCCCCCLLLLTAVFERKMKAKHKKKKTVKVTELKGKKKINLLYVDKKKKKF